MENPLGNALSNLPVVGKIFASLRKYDTYYKLDTNSMFRSSVHQSILVAVDRPTEAKGFRGLSDI